MSSNSVSELHSAQCLQSHIIYRCDLKRAQSPQIHLGILIELMGDEWNSLGVAVRRSLDATEIAAIAPAWRERLASPFAYFESEFEKAWMNAARGESINWLASEYGASLLVEPPQTLEHQRIVVTPAYAELEQAVRAHVFSMLDNEAKRFLNLSKPPAVMVESARAA